MREIIGIFAGLFGALGAVFTVMFGIAYVMDSLSCAGFQKGTGYETRYNLGCYANVDGKWVPKEYVFGNANEIRITGEATK